MLNNSLFFKSAGDKAPIAPVLNTPLNGEGPTILPHTNGSKLDKIFLSGYHFDFIEDFITKCFISKGSNDEIWVDLILLLFFLLSSIVKFRLSEKHTKFEKIFLMLWTFTK